jgi:Kef-type K+ transport system membrane component KefB
MEENEWTSIRNELVNSYFPLCLFRTEKVPEWKRPAYVFILFFVVATTPFWVVPLWHDDPDEPDYKGTLPFYLGISFVIFIAWTVGRLVSVVHLPPSFGYIIVGYCFSNFDDDKTESARDEIRLLTFLVVLIRAGLEISLPDIDRYSLLLGTVPVIADAMGVAVMAMFIFSYNFTTAAALGFVVAPLGDGVVIPKMQEFKSTHKKHDVPRRMFIAAPLEASTGLFMFGGVAFVRSSFSTQ